MTVKSLKMQFQEDKIGFQLCSANLVFAFIRVSQAQKLLAVPAQNASGKSVTRFQTHFALF